MALQEIPVLAENHPLFDWDDHAESRAALVSGGATMEFRRATWNAIVDTLSDALTAAGLSWNNKYTTVEGAKIAESGGALSAAAFNSVRHNIDRPAPIGWAWARFPDFRGYVGREDFRGWAQYRINGDKVYPEYIMELVRKLNLLIEIMRGTVGTYMMAQELSSTSHTATMAAIPSAPMSAEEEIKTSHTATLHAFLTAPMVSEEMSETLYDAEAVAVPAAPMFAAEMAQTQTDATLRPARVRPMIAMERINTQYEAELTAIRKIGYMHGSELSRTLYDAVMAAPPAVLIAAEGTSRSIESGEMAAILPQSMTGECVAKTAETAMLHAVRPLHIRGEGKAESLSDAVLEQLPPQPMQAEGRSMSQHSAVMDKMRVAAMSAEAMSETLSEATLESAWYPPVWIDGGLWIRQSHSVTPNDNGELVIV